MALTIDNALEDDSVTVIERDDNLGLYKIKVGVLETVITILLCRSIDSDETRYERSHTIKTPLQPTPYNQSRLFWDSPARALYEAISSMTEHYKEAVSKNITPNEGWFLVLKDKLI